MKASLLLIAPIMLVTGIARSQEVRLDANCVPQMSRLESRLYEKAAEGTDALRDFIFIRRGVYQLDTMETAAWASNVNAARSACKAVAAGAVDVPTPMVLLTATR